MSLRYQPKEGSVLICDFRGYEVPEMIKVRPVVVIRKHRTNSLLVTVVPLSTTAPDCVLDHHLKLASHLHGASPICWAKCDMVATVSLSRLDRIKSRDRQGKRIYLISQLAIDEFFAIKAAVRSALGL
ncbi:type II toxin-antitoxin system PemK/MazF family toxin [Pseudomonas wuhanensis]